MVAGSGSVYLKAVHVLALIMGSSSSLIPFNAAAAPDPSCLSYLTVGDSDCKKIVTPPPAPVSQRQPMRNMVVPEDKSEVDKYLDNYGKPPREFVEFYLNPTAENASKWVKTYQQMLGKGQDLSKAWSEAEQLYGVTSQGAGGAQTPALIEPSPQIQYPAQSAGASQVPERPTTPPAQSFGAFSSTPASQGSLATGIRTKGVSLTYFFSQTCPYCARMTPDLSVLSKEMSDKLTFTCVDVTPIGPTARPNPDYIKAQLPCNWRLPAEGEVEKEQVSQTPTLVITREGEVPVRLSGYVPLAQLRQYFQ